SSTAVSLPPVGSAQGASGEGAFMSHLGMELEVDMFPTMRHVSLHWHGSDRVLRRDIEIELAKALTQTSTPSNPVGGWMLSLAVFLFLLSALGRFAIIVFRILQLPG